MNGNKTSGAVYTNGSVGLSYRLITELIVTPFAEQDT